MLRNLLLSAVLATFATSAVAADLWTPTTASPLYAAPSSFDWTGFYVGANGGYAWGGQSLDSLSFAGAAFDLSGVGGRSMSADGAFAGGTVGANLQYGQTVFGLEGDLDWSKLRGSTTLEGTDIALSENADALGTMRGRLGYAFGRLLPYVTGGLYWQPSRVSISTPTYLGPSGATANAASFGWTLGGGLEYALTRNWSVKGEYLYARGRDLSFNYTTPVSTATIKTNDSVNIVRGGLNYRF